MPPRSPWSVAVSSLALLVPLLPLGPLPGPWPAEPRSVAEAAPAELVGSEYVVAFDPAQPAAYVDRTVTEAGGRVLDVNRALGVALVHSDDRSFLADVRAADGVRGAAYNQAVGTSHLGMPHRYASERPRRSGSGSTPGPVSWPAPGPPTSETRSEEVSRPVAAVADEPLAGRQWNLAMIGATAGQAHRRVTGAGVDVGIIDTGIDGRHPDIAPNFDPGRSWNFVTDEPALDGPCEVPSCVDPPDVDDQGHGTHVAGIVAAARNGLGVSGVAPNARLVSLRAGQDSGYFFLYETASALVAAGDLGLDVVNMSFYTDPWLYNCTSRDEYVAGSVTSEELAQQRLTRQVIGDALEYAHDHGVTLVAAAGNEHTDLAAPQRFDPFVPSDRPGGPPRTRIVRNSCLNMPGEGPHVVSVGAVGPSGRKADYSDWGYPRMALVAPGGWFGDRIRTPSYQRPDNLILSAYPLDAAIAQGLAHRDGRPVDAFSARSCDASGRVCGFYTSLQGSSMASPHVVGVAALIIQRYGRGSPATGYSLSPDQVATLLARTATDHPCPASGAESYAPEGRGPEWTARCTGPAAVNEVYGEGIVSAAPLAR